LVVSLNVTYSHGHKKPKLYGYKTIISLKMTKAN